MLHSTEHTTYLFMEHRFSLTSVTLLLVVVTALSLSKRGSLPCLVLSHFVLGVPPASFAGAKSASFLRDIHLIMKG